MRRSFAIFAVLVAAGLMSAQGAVASTVPATCGTLQTALNNAGNGDVVQLTGVCSDQSFTITNTNTFTVEGVGSSGGIPSSGFNGNSSASGGQPILNSVDDVHVTIQNLLFENATLTDSSTALNGAAIRINGVTDGATIKNDAFTDNSGGSSSLGGAVFLQAQNTTSPFSLQNNTFTGNHSADGGGAYLFTSGPVQVTGNTFKSNAESETGAEDIVAGGLDVEIYHGAQDDPITVSRNTFQGNTAKGWGGGAFISAGGSTPSNGETVTLQDNRFIDNQVVGNVPAQHLGGAVAFGVGDDEWAFKVAQSGNLFQGNKVGGAIPSGDTDDDAGGGAEWGTAVNVTSTRDTFIGNSVTTTGIPSPYAPMGGGVGVIGFLASYTAVLANPISSSFTGSDDLFLGNAVTAPGSWGGAIYTGGGQEDDCIDSAHPDPVPACPASHLVLEDSTVKGNGVNTATGEGGGIWGGPKDTARIDNTIVYGNKGVAGAPEIWGYTNPSYSHDDVCTMPNGGMPLTGAGNICAPPALTATGAETASSPTIDKGSNGLVPSGLTTDAAGKPRITEGSATTCAAIVDMGAFEFPHVACAPVPGATKAPAISGKPLRGQTLACSSGTWSHSPTSYQYRWYRDGSAIPGATQSTYKVAILDSARTLSCRVTARNGSGAGKPAKSAGVLIAKAGTLSCAKPTGKVGGINAGPLALGMTKGQARQKLHPVTKSGGSSLYCLYGGFDIRAVFATDKPAKDQMILAVTSNPFYRLDGIQPGTQVSASRSKLAKAKRYSVQGVTWYVIAGKRSNGVVKVSDGIVQVVGVANRKRTATQSGAVALLKIVNK